MTVTACAALLAIACSEIPAAPVLEHSPAFQRATVAGSVAVSPVASEVALGNTSELTATVRDAGGRELELVAVEWSSSDPAVASVASTHEGSGAAFVTAHAPGSVIITAGVGGLAGTAVVTVSAAEHLSPALSGTSTPGGIWISKTELMALPASGTAWNSLKKMADSNCGAVNLANQDQNNNVCIMAKALVFARIGGTGYRAAVLAAVRSVVNSGTYTGRALALGRELAAYVIAADLINLAAVDPVLDGRFRTKIRSLLTTYTSGGPRNLIACHEQRPNNWGTHCGASRIAVAAYLNDTAQLQRAAQVFSGYLGNRAAYAGFKYGDVSWQCNAATPVGINPAGCTRSGHSVDGVLPDDQRRGGSYTWPPPKENYVYEALQGGLAQALMLSRRGYDTWNMQNRALLRAFKWLHYQASYPAGGDDGWQPHLINKIYGTSFPAPVPARTGKNVGWTDWTHR